MEPLCRMKVPSSEGTYARMITCQKNWSMPKYRGRVVLKRKLHQGTHCSVLCGKRHKMAVNTEPLLRLQLGHLKPAIRIGKVDEK